MDTLKQIAEENGKGIRSMFNACMHKSECCSKDDEIASLKRQLEEANSELDVEKFNLKKLHAVKDQLAESQAREARLRAALIRHQELTRPLDSTVAALALPHDDTALNEYRDAVIEQCANVCEKSDRYRGDYFAEKIRRLK